MKNLALIFGLATILLSDANAMKPAEQSKNAQERIPIALYTVNLQPPVEVLMFPSEEKVQLGGLMAREINLSCRNYNGLPVYAPIRIRYDMSLNEVVNSLCASFGVEGVECREGSMPKKDFEKMFPSFLDRL